MEEAFPESLAVTQAAVDACAARENATFETKRALSVQEKDDTEAASVVDTQVVDQPRVEYQLVKHANIADKLNALQDQYDSESVIHFSLDAEWDVNPYRRNDANQGKCGRIPLVQIGYRLPGENQVKALLLKLNHRGATLPQALVSFLTKDWD
jgi:hypothetical protein